MKTLSIALLALTLTACGSSSDDSSTPITPEPIPPIVEPSPEPPVTDPVEPVLPTPEPPVECTDNCDVYVNPIDVIITPIDEVIIVEPIEVIVEPITGECIGVPVHTSSDAYYSIQLKDACTGETYVNPTDSNYELNGFNWDYTVHVEMVREGNEFATILATTGDSTIENSYMGGWFEFYSNNTIYAQYAIYYTLPSIYVADYSNNGFKCDVYFDKSKASYCEYHDSVQRFYLDESVIDNAPIPTNIKEDYAFIISAYLKAELGL